MFVNKDETTMGNNVEIKTWKQKGARESLRFKSCLLGEVVFSRFGGGKTMS